MLINMVTVLIRLVFVFFWLKMSFNVVNVFELIMFLVVVGFLDMFKSIFEIRFLVLRFFRDSKWKSFEK